MILEKSNKERDEYLSRTYRYPRRSMCPYVAGNRRLLHINNDIPSVSKIGKQKLSGHFLPLHHWHERSG